MKQVGIFLIVWGTINLVYFVGCKGTPTGPEKTPPKGPFETEYDKSLIKDLQLRIDSVFVEYWDKDNVQRRKALFYPTIWWQFSDYKTRDTISSFYSIDNISYVSNGNRAMLEGRFYTAWWEHSRYDVDKVWIRCEYKNKIIFKSGFRIK
jgi:hypothetical protein